MPTSPSASPVVEKQVQPKPVKEEKSAQPVAVKPAADKKSTGYRQRILRRVVVGVVLGSVLVAGIVFIFINLRRESLGLSQKRSALEAASRQEESYLQLKQSLKLVESEAVLINHALLTEPDVNHLLDLISEIKKRHGLAAGTLAFSSDQPRPDRNGNPNIELVFESVGNLDQIQAFLKELISQPRLVKVELIDISGIGGESQRLTLKARFYTDPEFTIQK